MSSLLRFGRIGCDVLFVGDGQAALAGVQRLASTGFKGKIICAGSNSSWQASYGREHRLGQSRDGFTLFPGTSFHDGKAFITNDESRREMVSVGVQAVEHFSADQVDGVDSPVLKLIRDGEKWLALCANNMVIEATRPIVCVGAGPPLTLAAAGVQLPEASDKRKSRNEIVTYDAVLSLPAHSFENKRIIVYGGSATAAWVMEQILIRGLKVAKIIWLADDFRGANPGGKRNLEIEQQASRFRTKGGLKQVQYMGGDTPPAGEPGLLAMLEGSKEELGADLIIVAIGQNPEEGIKKLLTPEEFAKIRPEVGPNGGVYGVSESGLLVTSTPMIHKPEFADMVRSKTFPLLAPENQVTAGALVARLSGIAAVDAMITGKK